MRIFFGATEFTAQEIKTTTLPRSRSFAGNSRKEPTDIEVHLHKWRRVYQDMWSKPEDYFFIVLNGEELEVRFRDNNTPIQYHI